MGVNGWAFGNWNFFLNEYKIGDSHKYIIEGMRIWFCGKENCGFMAWKTPMYVDDADSHIWIMSTPQQQAMGYFSLILEYVFCSLLKTLLWLWSDKWYSCTLICVLSVMWDSLSCLSTSISLLTIELDQIMNSLKILLFCDLIPFCIENLVCIILFHYSFKKWK